MNLGSSQRTETEVLKRLLYVFDHLGATVGRQRSSRARRFQAWKQDQAAGYITQQQEAARCCVILRVTRTLCLQSCRRRSLLCRGCAGTRQAQAARRQHGAVQNGGTVRQGEARLHACCADPYQLRCVNPITSCAAPSRNSAESAGPRQAHPPVWMGAAVCRTAMAPLVLGRWGRLQGAAGRQASPQLAPGRRADQRAAGSCRRPCPRALAPTGQPPMMPQTLTGLQLLLLLQLVPPVLPPPPVLLLVPLLAPLPFLPLPPPLLRQPRASPWPAALPPLPCAAPR